MSDVSVKEELKLDLLDISEPALSASSDMPVIETKPDSQPDTKPAPKEEAKVEKKDDAAPSLEGKKPEESATPEQPDDSSASDEPKKAKGVQKRIDELVRQREEEKAEKLRLLAIVEGFNKPKQEPEAKQDEDQAPQKPVRESFGTTDEYVAALADYADAKATWSSEKAVKEALANQAKQSEQRQIEAGQKAAQEAYAKRVEDATKEYPDYKEVAESPDVTVSIPMAHAILQSEHGPKIAYHLGKNPEEAKRISQLSPPVQLIEMGLIVARLTAPAASPAPLKPVVSAAPKPLKPLESKSEPAAKSPQDMNMDEYAEYVRQRDKPQRAGART